MVIQDVHLKPAHCQYWRLASGPVLSGKSVCKSDIKIRRCSLVTMGNLLAWPESEQIHARYSACMTPVAIALGVAASKHVFPESKYSRFETSVSAWWPVYWSNWSRNQGLISSRKKTVFFATVPQTGSEIHQALYRKGTGVLVTTHLRLVPRLRIAMWTTNKLQQLFRLLIFLNQPYMFRATNSPILRSTFWLYIELLVQCTVMINYN